MNATPEYILYHLKKKNYAIRNKVKDLSTFLYSSKIIIHFFLRVLLKKHKNIYIITLCCIIVIFNFNISRVVFVEKL